MEKKLRYSGVLLHPTSLHGKYGIGDLGHQGEEFIQLLSKAGVTHWQILPLSPVGYGNSPYASQSAFAGNEMLISLDVLVDQQILQGEDLLPVPQFRDDFVEYQKVQEYKLPLLRKAVQSFLLLKKGPLLVEYQAFQEESEFWLEDYALYKALCDYYNDSRWFSMWDQKIADRDPLALATWKEKMSVEIEQYKVLQFFFHQQWQALHTFANDNKVSIIGDIPIFVAHDSVDAWCHRAFLKMDARGNLKKVAGVPPDAFSTTGQLWGNPVYDWKALKADNYSWWVKRMKHQFSMTDMVRIDHFRGFDAAWEVPSGDLTAENGKWVAGPGQDFFSVLKKEVGTLPVIAEDLGVITSSVEKLRDDNHFPGMRILQFGFNVNDEGDLDASHFYLPHNYDQLCVAYTGTHDNNTTRGWYNNLGERERDAIRRYLSCDDQSVVWYFIRAIMASSAQWAIIPFQDLIEADEKGRMNFPGTCGDHNWSYRIPPDSCSEDVMRKLEAIVKPFGRTSD